MKTVELAYGRSGLVVDLPASADTIEPRYMPGVPDEAGSLRQALRQPIAGPPLRDLVPRGATVGISVCDVTRPFPAQRVLPVLLEELDYLDPAAITVFVATGTHRRCTDAELLQMFGPELLGRVQLQQHDAFDVGRHRNLGTIPDTDVPAYVERAFLEQDIRITTGFIEPHFFAGFSGGPKMVAPGLAALETVLELHDARRIGDPRATWGVVEGNPVHDDVRAIAAATGVTYSFDVILNTEQQVVAAFGGDVLEMHAAPVQRAPPGA